MRKATEESEHTWLPFSSMLKLESSACSPSSCLHLSLFLCMCLCIFKYGYIYAFMHGSKRLGILIDNQYHDVLFIHLLFSVMFYFTSHINIHHSSVRHYTRHSVTRRTSVVNCQIAVSELGVGYITWCRWWYTKVSKSFLIIL